MFLPIPAIDLLAGQVVRLSRGEVSQKTVYSDDPLAFARKFYEAGARRLHIVDLDGAFGGEPKNLEIIHDIRIALPEMKIEVGGGLRTRSLVEQVLALGVDFAILGTSAVRDRKLVATLAAAHGKQLIVGIDAKDGKVAVEGWVQTSDLAATDFAGQLEQLGVGTIIATDIATDGMLTGPTTAFLTQLADSTRMNIIAAGGIRNVDDLLALRDLKRPNLIGAITGRAVYAGLLDIAAAIHALGG